MAFSFITFFHILLLSFFIILYIVHKDRRIAASRNLIATADRDPDFFKKIVTGDETWCFAYDPTTKRQFAAWVGETSPRPKKTAISDVSCEEHFGDFLRLARRNPQRICSGGWKYHCSVPGAN